MCKHVALETQSICNNQGMHFAVSVTVTTCMCWASKGGLGPGGTPQCSLWTSMPISGDLLYGGMLDTLAFTASPSCHLLFSKGACQIRALTNITLLLVAPEGTLPQTSDHAELC